MKKIIGLFLVLCLLLSIGVVSADSGVTTSNVKYDIDDFSAYLIKHNDGKNTKSLIDSYFKDKIKDNTLETNSENFTETKIIDGKEVKTVKEIKTVKISDTQDITFYENGFFGIGEVIVNEPEESFVMNTLSVYATTHQYQYDGYNSVGLWVGASSVSQEFLYDGTYVGISKYPTTSYRVNTA